MPRHGITSFKIFCNRPKVGTQLEVSVIDFKGKNTNATITDFGNKIKMLLAIHIEDFDCANATIIFSEGN